MITLNELISTLCPDGVEYAPITEVAKFVRGLTYSKDKESATGSIKVLRSNNINQSQNALDLSGVKTLDSSVKVKDHQKLWKDDILMSAASGSRLHVGKVAYIWEDMDYYFGGFMAVWRAKEKLMPRFLFHILTSSNFSSYLDKAISSTTINNLSETVLKPYLVPVPPLEIQQRIVNTLDTFTELEARLEAELKAELEAKKSQYEYFRELLLSESHLAQYAATATTLGKVGTFMRGRGIQKVDLHTEGLPAIHYGQIHAHYGTTTSSTKSFVTQALWDKSSRAKPGDVVIATTSESVEDVCKAIAWLGETEVAVSADAMYYAHELDPLFITYFFQSHHFGLHKSRISTGTKVKRISAAKMAGIPIAVPPIDIQRKIGTALNKLELLTTRLIEEIPAEVNDRRRQYEHYRSRLLTFNELEIA